MSRQVSRVRVFPVLQRPNPRTLTTNKGKAANIKIKLHRPPTRFLLRDRKNSRTKTDKLSFRKYDPSPEARRVQGNQDQ
jgi:large subunit ribosomal protein L33